MIKDKKKLILSLLIDVLIFVLCLLSFRIIGTKYIFVYGALLIGLNALYFINEDVRRKILLLYFQTIVIIVVSIFTALFLPNATILLPISVIFIFSLYLLVVSKKANTVFNFIIKYRYLIALAIFVICVCFQVHGSSVSWYEVAMGTGNPYDNELFGAARAIRTDEFNVQLPYYFSQYYNDYQQISYQMSISGQDMILGYNAPVINLLLIGKPFTWGYILFGNAFGLSWYWMSKLLLGMLVYFEVSKILTKNNLISFFGMFYVVFSPAMQWWFCPHMYDVFFWGAALLAIGYHFFIGDEKWKKVLTTVLAIQAFICFIIAFFYVKVNTLTIFSQCVFASSFSKTFIFYSIFCFKSTKCKISHEALHFVYFYQYRKYIYHFVNVLYFQNILHCIFHLISITFQIMQNICIQDIFDRLRHLTS